MESPGLRGWQSRDSGSVHNGTVGGTAASCCWPSAILPNGTFILLLILLVNKILLNIKF